MPLPKLKFILIVVPPTLHQFGILIFPLMLVLEKPPNIPKIMLAQFVKPYNCHKVYSVNYLKGEAEMFPTSST